MSEQAQEFADQILAVRRAQVETALEGMDLDARAHFLEGLSRLAAAIEVVGPCTSDGCGLGERDARRVSGS